MIRGLYFTRALSVTALVAGVLLPTLVQVPASAAGEPGQGAATQGNGDANGDNSLDLSDAIYLLSHLFQGGPSPVPCPGAAGAGGGLTGSPLPSTLQTECWGVESPPLPPVTCVAGGAGACGGQDGFYLAGCADMNRFIDNGDDTVTDTCTMLMWQQAVQFSDQNDPHPTWCEAMQYCKTLEFGDNGVGGLYDDWRLPNIRELRSILKFGDNGAQVAPPLAHNPWEVWSSTYRQGNAPGNRGKVFTSKGNGDINGNVLATASGGTLLVRAVRTILAGGGASESGWGAAPRGAGGATLGNGDVNGDNSLDLSDAIYLLSHLFQGGPAPVPCPGNPETETSCTDGADNDLDGDTDCADSDCDANPSCVETICNDSIDDDLDGDTDCDDSDCAGLADCPEAEICDDSIDNDEDDAVDCADDDCFAAPNCVPAGDDSLLPDTGQLTCRDEAGNDLLAADCIDENDPCFGQDASYDTGCSPLDRFLSNGDGTVTDTCTDLVWQQFDDETPRMWCDALDYCETLDLGGATDWRMPNAHELESLVHHGRYNPAIDPVFGDTPGVVTYWTSTTQQGFLAWNYISEVGLFSTGVGNKDKLFLVRAVREP